MANDRAESPQKGIQKGIWTELWLAGLEGGPSDEFVDLSPKMLVSLKINDGNRVNWERPFVLEVAAQGSISR